MIEKINLSGWIIAAMLLIILLLQRSCLKKDVMGPVSVHDTILIRGDSHLHVVQNTILKPYKVYYKDSIHKVDTTGIIKDYFASRVYQDTIRARDVTAVIEDSISSNKIMDHKVLIENSKNTQITVLQTKPTNKIYIGGLLGFSQHNLQPFAGITLALITQKNAFYSYTFDAVSKTHIIGMAWKIHFTRSK